MNHKSAGLISFHFHHTTILYKSTSVYNATKVQDRERAANERNTGFKGTNEAVSFAKC